MARMRWRPARKALSSTVGMGNLPLTASCVAAIRPSVAAGTIMNARISPSTGSSDSSVPTAI
jgi:hypothetical protein